MSDYYPFSSQENDLGLDKAPIVLPPHLVAQALHLNRFSIVGVLVNPEKQSMKGLINQLPYIWGVTDEVIGRIVDNKKFQFLFKTEEAINRVLQEGPWSFADWMIVAKRWDATVTEEDLKIVQFWVQVKGIPPHYLSKAVIKFIGDEFAEVVDVHFEDFSNLTDSVWVLVNWNVDNPLIFKRNFEFAGGEIVMLSFRYHRLKNFCTKCGMFTHDETVCPLQIHGDANNKLGDDTTEDIATGSGMYMRRQIFTNAFTNRGMKAGPSGVVSVPMTDTPRVDCDQLAETCRYLKAKLCRGKFPCGDNLGKAVATHQIGGCEEDAEYNPLSAGTESYLRTEAVYHPMEKRSHDDVFGNANTDETLQIDRGSGSKRKRDDYVRDMSSVVMYPVCEMKSNVGDLEKQGKVLYTDCKVDKVGDSVTSSVLVMNSNIKVEECESVGSSEYIN